MSSSTAEQPMRILVAEDDLVSQCVLKSLLPKLGYDVISVTDGRSAWEILQSKNAPRFALLDWMMPEMNGVDICKKVRATMTEAPPYIILLTAMSGKANVVEGLESGADDYIIKPFDRAELQARLKVGCRVLALQSVLTDRVRDLENALIQVKQLQGLLPICSYCKKIRDDRNYWQKVETYIENKSEARFSHGICPDCYENIMRELDAEQKAN